MYISEDLKHKLFSRIFIPFEATENDCWEWTGNKDAKGYGLLKVGFGITRRAHRIAYLLYNGFILADTIICHTCDSPSCVSPMHLYAGTHKSNSEDMAKRDRRNPLLGESHQNSKLNKEQVLEIRKLASEKNITWSNIAKQFKISKSGVMMIVTRRSWNHI